MNGVETRSPPFSIPGWTDGRSVAIDCVEILRHLPERRLVARGRVDGREAAVKLFFGDGARRRFRREKDGLSRIAGTGVPVPAILADGRFEDGWWIAVEWLPGRAADANDLQAIVVQNARLHAGGVVQKDPHLGNFVVLDDRLFLIDGGAVAARRMGRRAGLAALALQLAALDAEPAAVERAHRVYSAARNWDADVRERARLLIYVRRMQRRRVRRFVAKTLRRCTQFEVERRDGREVVYERSAMCAELAQLLDAPETAVEGGQSLKDGNTATVARVCIGALRCVVKRYNAKRGRARRAWTNGHRLCFRGIPTARPLAVAMPRGGEPAYLVLEDVAGITLDEHVARHGLDAATVEAVAGLFATLSREGLAHRDTKATNFIVSGETVSLVDLDALRPARWRGELARDRERFLENWDATTAARFAEAFTNVFAGRFDAGGPA